MDTNNQTEPLDVVFTLAVANISESLQAKALEKAREAYVMILLGEAAISSGKAASLLGMSRLDVLDHMSKWGISIFDDTLSPHELEQDVARASKLLERPIK